MKKTLLVTFLMGISPTIFAKQNTLVKEIFYRLKKSSNYDCEVNVNLEAKRIRIVSTMHNLKPYQYVDIDMKDLGNPDYLTRVEGNPQFNRVEQLSGNMGPQWSYGKSYTHLKFYYNADDNYAVRVQHSYGKILEMTKHQVDFTCMHHPNIVIPAKDSENFVPRYKDSIYFVPYKSLMDAVNP